MAGRLTPQQSPQGPSSSFWQLISGVAHDLDLMLQDLFPDSIPSPLREEYGLPDDFTMDDALAGHPSLLEQFMRGAGDDGGPQLPEDPSSEYQTSKSIVGLPDTPTSDSYDGRTTPTTTSSPSPPPPAPPPRSAQYPVYSAHLHNMGLSGNGQTAMVSSSSVSSVQETSDGDGDSSRTSSSFAPCDIGLLERLIRTHPIWFLPGIGRAGAVHLLQGKEVGNFIVRQSSKPNTMALSVRLPESKGPYVEHYLIETVGEGKLRLEGSDNNFHAIPMLVAHYCQCCDELPVQLALPRPLAQAGSRQELSSLALLGQDFWLSSLVQSPTNGTPAVPFSGSSVQNNDVQHSTFRPPPPVPPGTPGKLPGNASPPSTLPLSFSHQDWEQNDSSSPGSPPPPVAPKHQAHNIPPPPPPPRSFLSARGLSSTNVSSNASHNASLTSLTGALEETSDDTMKGNVQDSPGQQNLEVTTQQAKLDDGDKKNGKKIARVAHYKQSNIIDPPVMYYRSSLADKISDYEDIWGSTLSGEKDKRGDFITFKPSSLRNSDIGHIQNWRQLAHNSLNRDDNERLLTLRSKYMASQSTQTDIFEENGCITIVPGRLVRDFQDSNHAAVTLEEVINADAKAHNHLGVALEMISSEGSNGHFSSPFYSEPIDSIPYLVDSNKQRTEFIKGEIGLLPQRLFNHRFSDPNLHWPQNSSFRKTDPLDEEKGTSLSSSVDNIKNLSPSPQHRRHQSLGLTNHWIQELHQRVAGPNMFKKDSETQVSMQDIYCSQSDSANIASPKNKVPQNSSWPVDSSWEWLAQEDSSDDDIPVSTLDSKFPLHLKTKHDMNHMSDSTTVEDLIALKSPELKVPEIKPLTQSNLMRVSEYDNLGCDIESAARAQHQSNSEIADDTATEFSEPWDSLRWERLLRLVIPETDILGDDTVQREKRENNKNVFIENDKNKIIGQEESPALIKFEDTESESVVSGTSDVISEGNDDATSILEYPTISIDRERSKSFQERLEPLLAAQRVVALRNKGTIIGEPIRQYIFRLAEERNNTFAMSVENFIQCTKESNETNPIIVMRNIRQFMSGMKNYLVKHGEGQFDHLVQQERSKLKPDEFLNIDAIIEGALHKLVIKPLKSFLYQLFVNEYTRKGSLKLLSDNIKYARTKTPEEIGVRSEFKPPHGTSLEVVKHFLTKLQQAYSPLKKLENLLAAISTIYNSVQQDKEALGKDHMSLGADDFLPIFICVLVQCGLIAAEIEADYMWGLLHPSLMSGEGGYYLTTLSSAVHVLKNLQSCAVESPQRAYPNTPFTTGAYRIPGPKPSSPEPRFPCIADLQGFMKIMIPDELTGSIISKTLPVRPNMNTKEVCKMIAHKFNITNPQDYCLFKLMKGEETQLSDNECPQTVKADLLATGVECLFAYKRCDAKFVWPVLDKQ